MNKHQCSCRYVIQFDELNVFLLLNNVYLTCMSPGSMTDSEGDGGRNSRNDKGLVHTRGEQQQC